MRPVIARLPGGMRAGVASCGPMSWADLAALLTAHEVGEKAGSAWMPADIDPGPRKGERVRAVTALVLDVEARHEDVKDATGTKAGTRVTGPLPPPLPELVQRIEREGWAAIVATSHSHEAPALPSGTLGPRLRVVFPIDRTLGHREVRVLALAAAARLGLADCADTSTMEPARLFFLPRCPAERKHLAAHAIVTGAPLPVDELVNLAPELALPEAAPAAPREQVQERMQGASAAARETATREQVQELRSALQALDADDYSTWIACGHRLKGLGDVGRDLWLTWSQTSDKWQPGDAARWQTFKPERAGFAGVFAAAQAAGWVNPASRAAKAQGASAGEAPAEELQQAVEKIVAQAEAGDVGAPFEPEALAALRSLQAQDFAGWVRLRTRLKRVGVGVTELDRQIQHGDGAPPEDDETVADKLIALARGRCTFVHDAQHEPFAIFEAGGARQVHGVLSRGFADFLSHAYYTEHDRAPTEQSLKVALATLRGQAQFEGAEREVFVRIAKTETGYWLDLCNAAWQCVQITATGWAVVSGEAAPLFTRSASMRPLPVPESGGTLDALWPLVNIPEADRLMVLSWLVECLRPDTPHVVLELVGEQGSAKSSTQKALRRLIDPNQADLRAAPKSVEDVWIAARNAHLVSMENLSHLNGQYQDALCVLATGGGFSTRTLYTNAEETILDLRKPIVLNGISVIVTAQDLLDRCLHVGLPTVQARELAGDMEERFEAAQPRLLGALLDLFAQVLATLPSVTIAPEQRPRMADFAMLGEAIHRLHGQPAGAFLDRHNAMRAEGVHRTLDASPVGAALVAYLAEDRGGFEGTLAELLRRLERYRPQGESWPRSPKGLGDALRRLAPALRQIGYECKATPKTGGSIRWHIFSRPYPPRPSPGSLGSPGLAHPFPEPYPPRPSPGSPGSPGRSPAGWSKAGHAGHAGHGLGGNGAEKGMPHDGTDRVEVF